MAIQPIGPTDPLFAASLVRRWMSAAHSSLVALIQVGGFDVATLTDLIQAATYAATLVDQASDPSAANVPTMQTLAAAFLQVTARVDNLQRTTNAPAIAAHLTRFSADRDQLADALSYTTLFHTLKSGYASLARQVSVQGGGAMTDFAQAIDTANQIFEADLKGSTPATAADIEARLDILRNTINKVQPPPKNDNAAALKEIDELATASGALTQTFTLAQRLLDAIPAEDLDLGNIG